MNPLLLIALVGGAAALFFASRKGESKLGPGRHRITATVRRPDTIRADIFAKQLTDALIAGGAQNPSVSQSQPARAVWTTPIVVSETALPEFVPLTLPGGPVAVHIVSHERLR